MKFNTRTDQENWAKVYNFMPLQIDQILLRYAKPTCLSHDPKLRILSDILEKLSKDFTNRLHKEMDRIEFEFSGE